jgi:NAD(P)H dehydrogenase (quinone)
MQKKKIFVLLGHPDKETRGGSFADAYERGATAAGYEVRRVNLGDLKFDPILHKGYKAIQELEPDLKMVQENFKWADHIALFYPNWFCTMPALLKGMFDRMWLPGFAYHFKKGHYAGWEKLLKGKTSTVFLTMEGEWLAEYILFGNYTNEIKKGVFGFAGIKTNIKRIDNLKGADEAKLNKIRAKAESWGKKGY